MYDTAKRVALVKQRVRENTRRRQRRGIYGLSAACMLLFAVLMQAADVFVSAGADRRMGRVRRDAAAGGRGRLCAGGRRLLCSGGGRSPRCASRLRSRENQIKRRDGQTEPQKQEGKTNEENEFLAALLSLLHDAHACCQLRRLQR